MGEKLRAHHWEQDCKRYANDALAWERQWRETQAECDRLEAKVQRLSYPRAWMTCKTHGTPDARAWGCPQCVDELRADRDRLAAENAALRADSERYRYIQRFLKNPVLLDAAIDAARGAGDQ